MATATTTQEYAEQSTAWSPTPRAPLKARLILVIFPVVLIVLAVSVARSLNETPIHATTRNSTAAIVNPALILRPRTTTLTGAAGIVAVKLKVSPLIPGTNYLALSLTQHGQPLTGARVSLQITMPGMPMHPLQTNAPAGDHGVYRVMAQLRMFGGWQIAARVITPHHAPLSYVFPLNMDIPAGILKAIGSVR